MTQTTTHSPYDTRYQVTYTVDVGERAELDDSVEQSKAALFNDQRITDVGWAHPDGRTLMFGGTITAESLDAAVRQAQPMFYAALVAGNLANGSRWTAVEAKLVG